MIVSRTRDKKALAKIFNHPKVKDYLSDDLTPDGYYVPVLHEAIIYLMDDSKKGAVRIDPMNGICCMAHISTTPAMWGNASEFAKLSMAWVFKHTRYMKIVGMIPAYNDKTIGLANKIGMIKEGVVTKAFLKNFVLHDLHIYGVEKHTEDTENA